MYTTNALSRYKLRFFHFLDLRPITEFRELTLESDYAATYYYCIICRCSSIPLCWYYAIERGVGTTKNVMLTLKNKTIESQNESDVAKFIIH